MENPKISIIVPIYNVEKYLNECLNSIINQTFSDIEIICVNDGSKDNSRNILEEYAKKDCRIKIIDKQNGGLSSARNAGLNVANGDFIIFVDSDDWIAPDMAEKLYNNAILFNTDISICSVHLFDEQTKEINNNEPYFSLAHFDSSFNNKVFSYKDTIPFLMDVCVMAWNKIYRKSFLDKCNAQFPDGLIFEDGPFFFSIFFKTQRIAIVRDFLYYYRINRQGSIVQKGGKKLFDIINVVNLMFDEIKNLDIFDEIKYSFFQKKADDIIYRYELLPLNLKNKYSKIFRKTSCLLNQQIFDFAKINQDFPWTYKNFCALKNNSNIFLFYYHKFEIKCMYKIMQILYFDNENYYFKLKKLVLKIKKNKDYADIYYLNDKIYVELFKKWNIPRKFNFKFEYSKLEK